MLGEIIEKQMINELNKYCKEVNKLYKSGNIESSYNKPMIDLISSFGCLAHDFSVFKRLKNIASTDTQKLATIIIHKQTLLNLAIIIPILK